MLNFFNIHNQSNDNVSNQEKNNISENNKTYTYSEMKGLYKFEYKNLNENSKIEYKTTYNLYLYENGTFVYKMLNIAPSGYIRNYIIENNEIKLNYLFSFNSGTGIKSIKETKILTINSNNSITDENQPIDTINLTNITLTKTNETEENKFITDGNDFDKILNKYNVENTEN